jgi:hypothetical protein
MTSSRDDLLDLSDYAYTRLRTRLKGLTDGEYHWEFGTLTTLKWRLGHIIDFLQEERNGPWIGRPPAPPAPVAVGSAAEVLATLDQAYQTWRNLLEATTEDALAQPIGPIAGHYGDSTRRSFVLHVLDELIHHGAEAALIRDLHESLQN